MMPLSTARQGKMHGNILRSQQTLLSSLSPLCLPSTAAQRGILTAGGSHYRPLASSFCQPPDSALLRDSPHALKKKDPRRLSGALGAACIIPSEERAGKLPSKTHLQAALPSTVLSAGSFQAGFYRVMGELDWMKPQDQYLCLSWAPDAQTHIILQSPQ